MKWFLGVVAVLIVGWIAAVWFFNRNGAGPVRLQNTDSSQAKQSLPTDSLRKDSLGLDSVKTSSGTLDTIEKKPLPLPNGAINTKGVQPRDVVNYAKTLIGIPYLYGSTDPAKGFDCSGFITHVFNRFGIAVPRSSIDFTNVGKEVSAAQAKEGDLILFTGTDSTERFVGHMGIVVENKDSLRFIHSTSGKQHGVTITPLNSYYQGRYVKTIRLFPQ